MKILLIGNTGQVGWELQRSLSPLGQVIGVDYPEIDLKKPDNTLKWVRKTAPAVIINAAAYTDVDGAEEYFDMANAINAVAPGILAEEAHARKAAFIHFSTDFVFDGRKSSPYMEEDDPNPLGAYGKTKHDGEVAVMQAGSAAITLRTAWVYSTRRPCFVTKVLKWSRQFEELKIVTDQTSSPTWSRFLAEVCAQVIAMGHPDITAWLTDRKGLYHLAGDGGTNRYAWAKAIIQHDPLAEEQIVKKVLPASSQDFPTPAERPAYSVLNCDKFERTFGLRLPPWEESLKLAMSS